jgi:asparaginyl-tRNA synthetase
MDTVTIQSLSAYEGQDVQLKGWVYNTRSIGKIWFVILRDGTGLLQGVVVKGEATDETFAMEQDLNQEDAVIITGRVRKESRSVGGYELGIREIRVVSHVAEKYPISPKEHGTDFLMTNRHLWLRSKRQHAIMRVRHQTVKAIRDFFDGHGFTLIDSPIFTGNAVEGTTTLFAVDYFERSAYLTQSGQLYQEAGAAAFGKTYCFGPTFRAEKSKTRRHLTEFWMVEPEMAYCDLDENMDWAEKLVCFIMERVLENSNTELEILERDLSLLERVVAPFPRITYDEAVKILVDKGADFEYGSDFGAVDETIISAQFNQPVMIHRWPERIKAFYMKRDEHNEELALGVDMIAPDGYGEIVGGGQREDDHDTLIKRIKEHGLPMEPFQWYLDLRKYGSVPHAGFGLGIERTVELNRIFADPDTIGMAPLVNHAP